MDIKDVCVGLRVKWNDPDDGLCSGEGVITSYCDDGDEFVMVKKDDGGEVEALPQELELIPEEKEFTVTMVVDGRIDVKVKASSFDEAFDKASYEDFDPNDVNFVGFTPMSAEREDGAQKYY